MTGVGFPSDADPEQPTMEAATSQPKQYRQVLCQRIIVCLQFTISYPHKNCHSGHLLWASRSQPVSWLRSTPRFLTTRSSAGSIEVKTPRCPSTLCSEYLSVIRHGFYKTRSGMRRRFRCQSCGKTFCSTKGTPYYRLHHRRAVFDEVVSLSVEGVNKSAISRVKEIAWNTVHRWLERAAVSSRRLNHRKPSGL